MKVKLTQKPYYNKYFKKIVLVHKNHDTKFLKYSYRLLLSNKNYLIVTKDIKQLVSTLKKYDVKLLKSIRDSQLIVYYNDDNIENLVPKHFSIKEKYKPINESQITLQKNNTNLDVRQTLYFKKYRYKIDLKFSNKYGNENGYIMENLREELSEIYNNFKIKNSYRYSMMGKLYIECEEDDLLYIQLKYSDKILKIYKAVLTSEVN